MDTINVKNRENLSIVIVDSGLGGLSICAEIANGFSAKHSHRQVNLTYFNAWPEQNRGYNSLPEHADRIRVFNSALIAIEKLSPDLILIACNTLSILYSETPFARSTDIPVVGIIDFGVQMTFDQLQSHSDSQAIILGTRTTVESEAHKQKLIELGIPAQRIIGQQCDQLATCIESGPLREDVGLMIDGFLGEAAENVTVKGGKVFAVLCCTHFGYAHSLFKTWLKRHIGEGVEILNPNSAMSDFILDQFESELVGETSSTVKVKVLSRIAWNDEKVSAIAEVLSQISPQTADALKHYRQNTDLFEV